MQILREEDQKKTKMVEIMFVDVGKNIYPIQLCILILNKNIMDYSRRALEYIIVVDQEEGDLKK
jgi:hypothetical protein